MENVLNCFHFFTPSLTNSPQFLRHWSHLALVRTHQWQEAPEHLCYLLWWYSPVCHALSISGPQSIKIENPPYLFISCSLVNTTGGHPSVLNQICKRCCHPARQIVLGHKILGGTIRSCYHDYLLVGDPDGAVPWPVSIGERPLLWRWTIHRNPFCSGGCVSSANEQHPVVFDYRAVEPPTLSGVYQVVPLPIL